MMLHIPQASSQQIQVFFKLGVGLVNKKPGLIKKLVKNLKGVFLGIKIKFYQIIKSYQALIFHLNAVTSVKHTKFRKLDEK